MREIARYWGFLALAGLIFAWTAGAALSFILVLSVLSTIYFGFQAPVWCCAINRNGTLCRNNATGILLGCSKVRQHKWQKVKMMVPHGWRKLNRGLWVSPTQGVTTLAALGTVLSAVVSTVALFMADT